MKEIIGYQCQCGEIHKNIENIFTCTECGKEICIECSGFEEGLCWDCNDKKIKEEENIRLKCPSCGKQMFDNHYVKEGYGRIFGVTCSQCGYEKWDK